MPAAVLAAVAPMLVRATITDVASSGSLVGRLSAIGTAGALVGTFLTGYVLLGVVPVRTLIVGTGALLLLAGIVLQVRLGRRERHAIVAVLAVVGLALGAASTTIANPCQRESPYYCIAVRTDGDNPTGRTLVLDDLRHAHVDLADPTALEFAYIQWFAAATADLTADGAPARCAPRRRRRVLVPALPAGDRPGQPPRRAGAGSRRPGHRPRGARLHARRRDRGPARRCPADDPRGADRLPAPGRRRRVRRAVRAVAPHDDRVRARDRPGADARWPVRPEPHRRPGAAVRARRDGHAAPGVRARRRHHLERDVRRVRRRQRRPRRRRTSRSTRQRSKRRCERRRPARACSRATRRSMPSPPAPRS